MSDIKSDIKKEEENEDLAELNQNSSEKSDFGIKTEDMVQAGLYFGHRTSRVHPKMKPYISGISNNVHIIDVAKTGQKLEEALKFIEALIKENKNLLLVGAKIQTKELIKKTAEECGLAYVNERWLGGTLTNFEVIKKRIEYYKDMEKKSASEELEKYTKKEKAKMNQEIERLRKKFEGIKNLSRVPDAVFVLDMIKNDLAVKEARMKGVAVIGVCDTNTDPTLADYSIPANDDAISSVKYILKKVKTVILDAKSKIEK